MAQSYQNQRYVRPDNTESHSERGDGNAVYVALRRFPSVMLLKKILVTGQPESLHDRIASRGSIHGRSTRQAGQLDTPMIRTEAGRRRFLYSAVTVQQFNELPAALRGIEPAPVQERIPRTAAQ